MDSFLVLCFFSCFGTLFLKFIYFSLSFNLHILLTRWNIRLKCSLCLWTSFFTILCIVFLIITMKLVDSLGAWKCFDVLFCVDRASLGQYTYFLFVSKLNVLSQVMIFRLMLWSLPFSLLIYLGFWKSTYDLLIFKECVHESHIVPFYEYNGQFAMFIPLPWSKLP